MIAVPVPRLYKNPCTAWWYSILFESLRLMMVDTSL
jgi:hypothetical protein